MGISVINLGLNIRLNSVMCEQGFGNNLLWRAVQTACVVSVDSEQKTLSLRALCLPSVHPRPMRTSRSPASQISERSS